MREKRWRERRRGGKGRPRGGVGRVYEIDGCAHVRVGVRARVCFTSGMLRSNCKREGERERERETDRERVCVCECEHTSVSHVCCGDPGGNDLSLSLSVCLPLSTPRLFSIPLHLSIPFPLSIIFHLSIALHHAPACVGRSDPHRAWVSCM